MRNAILVAGIFFALCMNVCAEEETKKDAVAKDKEPAAEENVKGRKHIDVNLPPEDDTGKGSGEKERGVMEPYESYDENTGMPNVVKSDEEGNLN